MRLMSRPSYTHAHYPHKHTHGGKRSVNKQSRGIVVRQKTSVVVCLPGQQVVLQSVSIYIDKFTTIQPFTFSEAKTTASKARLNVSAKINTGSRLRIQCGKKRERIKSRHQPVNINFKGQLVRCKIAQQRSI